MKEVLYWVVCGGKRKAEEQSGERNLEEGIENVELEKMMKQLQKMKNGRSPCVFNI